MNRVFTCIVCPNGCEITADGDETQGYTIAGAGCSKGREYVLQEMRDPRRTIATSVPVEKGEFPLVSVRLDTPISKKMIFPVMKEINRLRVDAPVKIGQILIENVLGLNCNVIATRNVDRTSETTRSSAPQRMEEE